MTIVLFIIFLVLMVIGVPVGFGIGIATMCGFIVLGGNMQIIASKMYLGIDNFTFLCIPLFILASEIMTVGRITERIVIFCDNLVGHIVGGLAHVNVLGSMLFAGITGSATADAAGLGTIEIEMMTKAGYDRDFSAGITAASAIIGPIIPPSTCMIIYAVIAGNVSVVSLFLGGIGPGIIIGLCLMVACYVISKKRNYPRRQKMASLSEIFKSFVSTFPALFMPMIIIGGILAGIFTTTESAAVAVLYALLVSFFVLKTLNLKELYYCLLRTAKTTANVMFIIAIATAMGWAVTTLQIPQKVAAGFMTYANSQFLFLLLSNILLLIVGTLLDQTPALLIMVPVLMPGAIAYGINPIHFGVMVCVNLCIGLVSPPIGMTLFVTSNVAKISLSRMYKAILPFLLVEIIALAIITYIPQITLFIPGLFGY